MAYEKNNKNRYKISTVTDPYGVILNPDIIYTSLCKRQQIYYIHNVVQMQLISYIHNVVQFATDLLYTQRCANATNILYTQCRQMAILNAPKVLLLTNKTKLTLTVTLTLTDTVMQKSKTKLTLTVQRKVFFRCS